MGAGPANDRTDAITFLGTRDDVPGSQTQDSIMEPVNADLVQFSKCPEMIMQDILDKPNGCSATIRHHTAALHLDKPCAMVEHDRQLALDSMDIEGKPEEFAKLNRVFINMGDRFRQEEGCAGMCDNCSV